MRIDGIKMFSSREAVRQLNKVIWMRERPCRFVKGYPGYDAHYERLAQEEAKLIELLAPFAEDSQ